MKVINSKYEIEQHALIKAWIEGVPVEEEALAQLRKTASLPFIYKWVAAMPDVHKGKGSTVGTVIATQGAIIPAAVGVDLGCGMCAYQLNLKADQLPDSLSTLRAAIEKAVPHGRTDNGGAHDIGAWGANNTPPARVQTAASVMIRGLQDLRAHGDNWRGGVVHRHPELCGTEYKIEHQLGTLGTGNHFVEICLDEENRVWVMLHSGSRGIGNRIGSYFMTKAKEQAETYGYAHYIADMDLAWLSEDTPIFDDYIAAIGWAQDYAATNRAIMLAQVVDAIEEELATPITGESIAINCHHNYAVKEHHYGKNVWVTRKGAVRARQGDLGIIPGSMGAESYIVEGLGNPESFMSCSHGAGRRMSRTAARRSFTLADHERDTAGVECRKDLDVLDETPGAYKDIRAVIKAQADLVRVKHTLKQIACVKG